MEVREGQTFVSEMDSQHAKPPCYKDPMPVARVKEYTFITFGVIFLVVGVVALAVPVLPTTPFLILAAYCFSKGSDYLHDWLLNHKWFGPPIKDWRRNGAIKVQYKIVATLAMAGTGVMIYFETHIPPAGGRLCGFCGGAFRIYLVPARWSASEISKIREFRAR
jgi:uncharacterized protein